MATAWIYGVLLLLARSVPPRRDGRPAMFATLVGLFILSWAAGLWTRPWLDLHDDERAFPFALGGLLASLILATFSLSARRRAEPRPGRRSEDRRATVMTPLYWAAMLCGVAAVAAYYSNRSVWG